MSLKSLHEADIILHDPKKSLYTLKLSGITFSYRTMIHLDSVPHLHIYSFQWKISQPFGLKNVDDLIIKYQNPINGCLLIVFLIYTKQIFFTLFL